MRKKVRRKEWSGTREGFSVSGGLVVDRRRDEVKARHWGWQPCFSTGRQDLGGDYHREQGGGQGSDGAMTERGGKESSTRIVSNEKDLRGALSQNEPMMSTLNEYKAVVRNLQKILEEEVQNRMTLLWEANRLK